MNLKIMDSDSVRTQEHPERTDVEKRGLLFECNAFGHIWHLRVIPAFWCIMSIIIALAISLGFWQLDRMKQKESQIEEKQSHTTPLNITGHFIGPRLYLDNKTYQGKVGYEVIDVFETKESANRTTLRLINRGWIAATADRHELPDIPNPTSSKIQLEVFPDTWSTRIPTANIEHILPSVYRIQALNPEVQETLALPRQYFRATSGNGVLTTEHWQDQNNQLEMSPRRHLGYAMQWFSVAIVAFVILLSSSITMSSQHPPKQ